MMSWDFIVGFEEEPEDLDRFLSDRGYEGRTGSEGLLRTYKHRGKPIDLYFDRTEHEEGSEPDWGLLDTRRNIRFELMVQTKERPFCEEARGLAAETARRFHAVRFDSTTGEYKESD